MLTRRTAVRNLGLFLAGSPLLEAQHDLTNKGERLPAIDELVNVLDFEPVCKSRIPNNSYDFISAGVDNEWTLRRNRQAFERITFRRRMLADTSKMDLSITLFGQKAEMPIFIAPTSSHQMVHQEGELATARAAAQVKTIMLVSSISSYPIEEIAAAAPHPLWFQLYPDADEDGTRERVERALAAGCKLVCLTVDNPYRFQSERLERNRMSTGGQPGDAGSAARRRRTPEQQAPNRYLLRPTPTSRLTWSFLDQLRSWSKAPLLVKGILTAEDAGRSLEHGADGVVVSNHGGRLLDGDPATIEVLEEIVNAVGGKIPVLVDSGFRRGTDVLKALALGAKAVLVGRPPLWGLGAYGQAGVARVMELLQAELARAMGLSGCPNLASINRALVRAAP